MDDILGVGPAVSEDEEAGLGGVAALAAPALRRDFAHLAAGRVARIVASEDSVATRLERITLVVAPDLRADPFIRGVAREAAELILAAAAAAPERHTRAGLVAAYVSVLEARTIAVALRGGLHDCGALRDVLRVRRGKVLDYNVDILASTLRTGPPPVLPEHVYAALITGATRTHPVAPASAAVDTPPPPPPVSRAPTGRGRAARGGGRGGRGRSSRP